MFHQGHPEDIGKGECGIGNPNPRAATIHESVLYLLPQMTCSAIITTALLGRTRFAER